MKTSNAPVAGNFLHQRQIPSFWGSSGQFLGGYCVSLFLPITNALFFIVVFIIFGSFWHFFGILRPVLF
jgi:hypothetical protein